MRSVKFQDRIFRILHASHSNDCGRSAIRLLYGLQGLHIADLLKQPQQLTFRHPPVKTVDQKGDFC